MIFLKNIILCSATLAALAISGTAYASASETLTPDEYKRSADQTFLTYPEWFLVFSPEEYAIFAQKKPPHGFPFLGHISQFWESYWKIYQRTKDKYDFNTGYHVMVMVIGVSTTIEYGLRYIYEDYFGKISFVTRTNGMTNEEKLAAKTAQDYVDFIKVQPWYEFDFTTPLIKIWTDTGYFGPDNIRKYERKYALTAEYAVKALYAKLIKLGTQSAYDSPSPVTAILLDKQFVETTSDYDKVEVIKTNPDRSQLVLVPRYDQFKDYTAYLAHKNINFLEIAGNNSDILVSILVPSSWQKSQLDNSDIIFTQTILTNPQQKRIVFTTPVGILAETIRSLDQNDIKLEHIYDF